MKARNTVRVTSPAVDTKSGRMTAVIKQRPRTGEAEQSCKLAAGAENSLDQPSQSTKR